MANHDSRRTAGWWLLVVGLVALFGGCIYGLLPREGYPDLFWCGSPWVPDNSDELIYDLAEMKDTIRAHCLVARRGGEFAAAAAIVGLILASLGGGLLLVRKVRESGGHDSAPLLDSSLFLPPAGWLIDPDDSQRERWWTGADWTEARRRAEK